MGGKEYVIKENVTNFAHSSSIIETLLFPCSFICFFQKRSITNRTFCIKLFYPATCIDHIVFHILTAITASISTPTLIQKNYYFYYFLYLICPLPRRTDHSVVCCMHPFSYIYTVAFCGYQSQLVHLHCRISFSKSTLTPIIILKHYEGLSLTLTSDFSRG